MEKTKNSLYSEWYRTVLKRHLNHEFYSPTCGICKEERKFYLMTTKNEKENIR